MSLFYFDKAPYTMFRRHLFPHSQVTTDSTKAFGVNFEKTAVSIYGFHGLFGIVGKLCSKVDMKRAQLDYLKLVGSVFEESKIGKIM